MRSRLMGKKEREKGKRRKSVGESIEREVLEKKEGR